MHRLLLLTVPPRIVDPIMIEHVYLVIATDYVTMTTCSSPYLCFLRVSSVLPSRIAGTRYVKVNILTSLAAVVMVLLQFPPTTFEEIAVRSKLEKQWHLELLFLC